MMILPLAFFVSCCGGIRLFEIFHPRLDFFRANVGALGPANQVLMCSFVCMGSRASPHSALLGIPIQDPTIASDIAAGVRRERACRALSNQGM